MDSKQTRHIFSTIGWALFTFLLVPQLASAILAVVLTGINPAFAEQGWYLWVISYVPLYFVGFPLAVLLLKKTPDGNTDFYEKKTISPMAMVGFILIGYAITLILNLVSTGINSLIGQLLGKEVVNPLADMIGNSSAIVSFVVVVFIAPIMEELVFRKMLYKKLAPMGEATFAFTSALVFALFHGNLSQFFYAFVLGLILSVLYYRTGKLAYPIAFHMGINLLGGGIGTLLTAFGGEQAVMIYGFFALGLMMIGLVLGCVFVAKYRNQMRFMPGMIPGAKPSQVLTAPGMIAYFIVAFLMILATIFIL